MYTPPFGIKTLKVIFVSFLLHILSLEFLTLLLPLKCDMYSDRLEQSLEVCITAVHGSVGSKVQAGERERHIDCAFTDRPSWCREAIQIWSRLLIINMLCRLAHVISIYLYTHAVRVVAKDTDHYNLGKPLDGQPLGALCTPVTPLTHLENVEKHIVEPKMNEMCYD